MFVAVDAAVLLMKCRCLIVVWGARMAGERLSTGGRRLLWRRLSPHISVTVRRATSRSVGSPSPQTNCGGRGEGSWAISPRDRAARRFSANIRALERRLLVEGPLNTDSISPAGGIVDFSLSCA